MLGEIEIGVVTRLAAKAPQITHLDNPIATAVMPDRPAYCLGINLGTAEKIAQGTRQGVELTLYLAVKHQENELQRRRGAYLLIEAIGQLLNKQTLGLQIAPLKYTGFRNVTDEGDRAARMVLYEMTFTTQYNIEELEEEGAVELLGIGLSYLLNGSETAAATDNVELQK